MVEDLFEWSKDRYEHYLTSFHNLALYNLLSYMKDIFEDDEEIKKIYMSDTKVNDLLLASWQNEDEELKEEFGNFSEYKDCLLDITMMIDECFEDLDFLHLPELTRLHNRNNFELEKRLGIDLDQFVEIMPKDIRQLYEKTNNENNNLWQKINDMIKFIGHRIQYNGFNKLFWQGDKPIKETEIQLLLDTLFSAYFEKNDLSIYQEKLI